MDHGSLDWIQANDSYLLIMGKQVNNIDWLIGLLPSKQADGEEEE